MLNILKKKLAELIDSRLEPFRNEVFRSTDEVKSALGELLYLSQKEELELIRDMPLVDVAYGEDLRVGDIA